MLRQLSIRNLALIDSLDLDFGAGFNVVTGETGAGKSVLIGALSLVLGERADKDKIRRGAERCEIAAYFELPAEKLSEVGELLGDLDLAPCEDGTLLVRRVISAGGSRCFLNGSPVTAQTLRQFGDLLVEVHGPYEHQALLRPARQLELLDAYAGLAKPRRAMADAWQSLQNAIADRDAARNDAPSPERRDVLKFQLNEIKSAKLQPDEEDELRRRHQIAANSEELVALADAAANEIGGDDGITDRFASVSRSVRRLAQLDPDLGAPISERIELIHEELTDISRELADFCQDVEADPKEFRQMEERIALFQRLKRKYGGTIEAVIAHGVQVAESLDRMEHFDDWIAEREAAVKTARDACVVAAKTLAKARAAAAPKLAQQIDERLHHLGFASAEFAITLEKGELAATGSDRIDMHFAPNPGEGLRPLRQIASSGEMARVMLAVKAVLARNEDTPLLVFDEVDANVGGEVANRVGNQMRVIASDRQVLCISHLPQVAAAAHHHYCVAKEVADSRTFARIFPLDEPSRLDELARMLGGKHVSSVVLDHARQLIAAHQ